ncbi:CcmD family protein [Natronomonas amylolytica]
MEYLLLFGYGAIFAALMVYVLYLRSRLSAAEQRLDDLASDSDADSEV